MKASLVYGDSGTIPGTRPSISTEQVLNNSSGICEPGTGKKEMLAHHPVQPHSQWAQWIVFSASSDNGLEELRRLAVVSWVMGLPWRPPRHGGRSQNWI